jgi:hypothetical protein
VPAKNGCIPDAPDGEHSTQAGTLPEGATTAVPEAAPVPVCDDDADRAVPAVDGAVPVDVVVGAELVPVAAAPVGAVPEPPVVAAGGAPDVGCVVVTGLAVAGEAVAPSVPVPRVTIPFGVTLPGVAGVCAAAGNTAASKNSTA